MSKYQNGKIYKVWNTLNEDIYIGSTVQPLHKRMHEHRSDCQNQRNVSKKLFISMKKHGIENFYIELVEDFPCNTKEELVKREGELIRQQKPALNIYVPNRTNKEYQKDHAEHLKQHRHEKYLENKENVLKAVKEYYKNNQESIREKSKKYREENDAKIKQKAYEQIQCECGRMFSRHHKLRHLQSKVHKANIEK